MIGQIIKLSQPKIYQNNRISFIKSEKEDIFNIKKKPLAAVKARLSCSDAVNHRSEYIRKQTLRSFSNLTSAISNTSFQSSFFHLIWFMRYNLSKIVMPASLLF